MFYDYSIVCKYLTKNARTQDGVRLRHLQGPLATPPTLPRTRAARPPTVQCCRAGWAQMCFQNENLQFPPTRGRPFSSLAGEGGAFAFDRER